VVIGKQKVDRPINLRGEDMVFMEEDYLVSSDEEDSMHRDSSNEDFNLRDSNEFRKRKTSLVAPKFHKSVSGTNYSPPSNLISQNLIIGEQLGVGFAVSQQVSRSHWKEPPKKREKIIRAKRNEFFIPSPPGMEVSITRDGELQSKIIKSCAQCGKELGDSYRERQNQYFCVPDYEILFLPRCGGCKLPVSGGIRTFDSQTWHKPCFVCRICKTRIYSPSFFEDDYLNYPFCDNCNDKIPTCSLCQKRVDPNLTILNSEDRLLCSYCCPALFKREILISPSLYGLRGSLDRNPTRIPTANGMEVDVSPVHRYSPSLNST